MHVGKCFQEAQRPADKRAIERHCVQSDMQDMSIYVCRGKQEILEISVAEHKPGTNGNINSGGPLFYESNESMSHESMSQGYFLTK